MMHSSRRCKEDYKTAPITEAEKVMVDYVVKLTKMRPGLGRWITSVCGPLVSTIAAILQITLIASWFNYINRVADAARDRAARDRAPSISLHD